MKIKDKRKEHLSKDLAEKKKSEEALQASEERLRLITSQVPAILWSTDTELKFTSSTGAGLGALGLKKDQVVGMTLFEFLQTDDPDHLVIKAYRQAIKGNTASYEFEWDGRFFDCHVSPLKNSEGSIIGSIGFALDITDRKQMEIALRESKQKYKDLQDASIDGHAWTDMEGHLIEVNDAYKNMMGYSEDELRNLTYKDITPEKWHASEQLILTEQILTRGYSDPYEKELIRKDGTIFPVELRAYLIKDAQGNNTGMRAVVRDITDRKQAENTIRMTARELRESNITLKVLLKQRENDKSELEENILSNIKHIIMPYIEKLKKNKSMSEELAYLNILESNLKEIVSPFSSKLSFKYLDFTPKEIMVTNLIKDGKQDKDITELLSISIDTVKFHRKNIRKKLGIYGKRKNLRSHLLSIIK